MYGLLNPLTQMLYGVLIKKLCSFMCITYQGNRECVNCKLENQMITQSNLVTKEKNRL